MTRKISGDLDRSEAPHDLNVSFSVVRKQCCASWLGTYKWIGLGA